jgi:predicted phosphodiesterase
MPIRTESGFVGLLFIGDPHLSSIRPGRRIDDYESAVLRKLAACAEICTSERLFPVILGDLFHRAGENNLRLLNRLAEVLDLFPARPLTLEGNHDKAQVQLTELDALALLERGGHLQVASTMGIALSVTGVRDVYCVPYGTAIPDSLTGAADAREPIVMITHHDLAFNGAYPGAALLKAVEGATMAVNGHMHKNLGTVTMGQTVWHNPGNISRVSVDDKGHLPRAWRLLAGSTELEGVALPFDPAVFDLTGTTGSVPALHAHVAPASLFSSLLASDDTLDSARTDDGSILEEDLLEAAKGLPPGVLDVVKLLLAPAAAA